MPEEITNPTPIPTTITVTSTIPTSNTTTITTTATIPTAIKRDYNHYNWQKLKLEFVKSNMSIKAFGIKHSIPYDTLAKKASKWRKIIKSIKIKADQKLIQNAADKLVDMQNRHVEIGKEMQEIGMAELRTSYLEGTDAINAIKVGTQIEKDILQPTDQDMKQPVTIIFQALTDGQLKRPVEIIDVKAEVEEVEQPAPNITMPAIKRPDADKQDNGTVK